jgi:hypothetical protein
MKRLLLLISILMLVLLPMGCGNIDSIINSRVNDMIEKATGTYTIKIGGTAGLNFTGDYEVWLFHFDPDTQSISYTKDSHSVEGQVSEEYTFEGASTTAFFQKRSGGNETLSLEVWMDEALVATRETTEPWGSVWTIAGHVGED